MRIAQQLHNFSFPLSESQCKPFLLCFGPVGLLGGVRSECGRAEGSHRTFRALMPLVVLRAESPPWEKTDRGGSSSSFRGINFVRAGWQSQNAGECCGTGGNHQQQTDRRKILTTETLKWS
jgi:hypothetical protein